VATETLMLMGVAKAFGVGQCLRRSVAISVEQGAKSEIPSPHHSLHSSSAASDLKDRSFDNRLGSHDYQLRWGVGFGT
jgi:hypothetical protein